MNVRSTTALTPELKPLEASFLPTIDPRFLWLKYQILIHFKDWSKTIEVRPGDYESQRNKKGLYNCKSVNGININVHIVIEQASIMNKVSNVLAESLVKIH